MQPLSAERDLTPNPEQELQCWVCGKTKYFQLGTGNMITEECRE